MMKKKIILFVVMLVAIMCVGCTSPDSKDNSLVMDKNGKGTFSTKFGFDKSYFEQSKYGMKKSMTEYVDEVKTLVPAELGIKFETDTSSNSKYSYVTVSIDFDSIEDLNNKANAIMKETNKLYDNGGKDMTFVDYSNIFDKAVSSNTVDQEFQNCLKSNGISYDVNTNQYKILKFVLATGVSVDKVSDMDKVKTSIKANLVSDDGAKETSRSTSEVLAITQENDGEYLEVPPYLSTLFDNYLYNVVLVNKEKVVNYTAINSIAQAAMDNIVVGQVKSKFNEGKLAAYIKNNKQSNLSYLPTEGFKNIVADMGVAEAISNYNIVTDEVKAFKKLLANGQDNREKKSNFTVKYGDIYVDDLGKCCPIINGDMQSETAQIKISDKKGAVDNTKKEETTQKDTTTQTKTTDNNLDESPKTGDNLPIEMLLMVMAMTAVVIYGCIIYKKRNR